jgi:hypothetical protein
MGGEEWCGDGVEIWNDDVGRRRDELEGPLLEVAAGRGRTGEVRMALTGGTRGLCQPHST